MHFIRTINITKLAQMLAKGMDPNFQDPDTGGNRDFSNVTLIYVV